MNSTPAARKPHLDRYIPSRAHASSLWEEIGLPARGVALDEVLLNGVPYRVFERLAGVMVLTQQELRRIAGISRSTLQRREKEGRFTQTESDRIYRIAEVYLAALSLWHNKPEAARRWLTQPVKGLGGKNPVDMLQTMHGTQQVLDLIGRLEYGVVT